MYIHILIKILGIHLYTHTAISANVVRVTGSQTRPNNYLLFWNNFFPNKFLVLLEQLKNCSGTRKFCSGTNLTGLDMYTSLLD